MSDAKRHAKLRQQRIAAGLCARCGGPRDNPAAHRRCDKCLTYEREKQRTRATGGRGVGIESTSRANGWRQAAKWANKVKTSVVFARVEYPTCSWWAVPTREAFMAAEQAEHQRMRRALLPKSVARVLDEQFHGEAGRW